MAGEENMNLALTATGSNGQGRAAALLNDLADAQRRVHRHLVAASEEQEKAVEITSALVGELSSGVMSEGALIVHLERMVTSYVAQIRQGGNVEASDTRMPRSEELMDNLDEDALGAGYAGVADEPNESQEVPGPGAENSPAHEFEGESGRTEDFGDFDDVSLEGAAAEAGPATPPPFGADDQSVEGEGVQGEVDRHEDDEADQSESVPPQAIEVDADQGEEAQAHADDASQGEDVPPPAAEAVASQDESVQAQAAEVEDANDDDAQPHNAVAGQDDAVQPQAIESSVIQGDSAHAQADGTDPCLEGAGQESAEQEGGDDGRNQAQSPVLPEPEHNGVENTVPTMNAGVAAKSVKKKMERSVLSLLGGGTKGRTKP